MGDGACVQSLFTLFQAGAPLGVSESGRVSQWCAWLQVCVFELFWEGMCSAVSFRAEFFDCDGSDREESFEARGFSAHKSES